MQSERHWVGMRQPRIKSVTPCLFFAFVLLLSPVFTHAQETGEPIILQPQTEQGMVEQPIPEPAPPPSTDAISTEEPLLEQPEEELPAEEAPIDAAPAQAMPEENLASAPTTHLIACPNDLEKAAGFSDFLEALRAAVAAKDVAFIRTIMADDINISFGGDSGRDMFLSAWELESNPQGSAFWLEMEKLLALGGYTYISDTETQAVIFPCTFMPLPETDWMVRADPDIGGYDYAVAATPNATLYQDRELTTPLRQLEYMETVATDPSGNTTYDGLVGYTEEAALRSPIDYRVYFQPVGGTWKMTLFIAGD